MNAGLSCIRGFYIKHLSASVGIITGLDYFGICRTKKNVRWKWPFRTYRLQSNLISEETHRQLKGQREGNKMQAFRNEHLLRCISPLIRTLNGSRLHRPNRALCCHTAALPEFLKVEWQAEASSLDSGEAQTLDQVSMLCCYSLKLFVNMHSCTEYLCFCLPLLPFLFLFPLTI